MLGHERFFGYQEKKRKRERERLIRYGVFIFLIDKIEHILIVPKRRWSIVHMNIQKKSRIGEKVKKQKKTLSLL